MKLLTLNCNHLHIDNNGYTALTYMCENKLSNTIIKAYLTVLIHNNLLTVNIINNYIVDNYYHVIPNKILIEWYAENDIPKLTNMIYNDYDIDELIEKQNVKIKLLEEYETKRKEINPMTQCFICYDSCQNKQYIMTNCKHIFNICDKCDCSFNTMTKCLICNLPSTKERCYFT